VVIAVISVIAAFLLPVLARSKGSAQSVKCMSNLRQVVIAASMYWEEHDGATFRYRGTATNNGDIFWFGWLERSTGANEGKRGFNHAEGPIYPHIKNWDVTLCPSFSYHNQKLKLKATSATCGYGVNLHLTAPQLDNVNSVCRPSDTITFADSAQVNTFQAPASPDNPMIEEFYYVSTNQVEATAHFRHKGTANSAFYDGHVDREKPQEGSLDARMPDQVVGRLVSERLIVP
jgi:prepilin-type processing-associated H-X9-DG protein